MTTTPDAHPDPIPDTSLRALYARLATTHDAPTRDTILDAILAHPDYHQAPPGARAR